MAIRLTDAEIASLISEQKRLDKTLNLPPDLKGARLGHLRCSIPAKGVSGNRFMIIVRKSQANFLDFSVILAYQLPESNRLFRLRRYNGNSHEHTNVIEKNSFTTFHIHTATARYQKLGLKEDTYAEPTDRYRDVNGAICCMLEDCGFDTSTNVQQRLFEVM
jgi:hypothetical protein